MQSSGQFSTDVEGLVKVIESRAAVNSDVLALKLETGRVQPHDCWIPAWSLAVCHFRPPNLHDTEGFVSDFVSEY